MSSHRVNPLTQDEIKQRIRRVDDMNAELRDCGFPADHPARIELYAQRSELQDQLITPNNKWKSRKKK